MGWLSGLFGSSAATDSNSIPLAPAEQKRVDRLLADHPEAAGIPDYLRGLTALGVAQQGAWLAESGNNPAGAIAAVSKAWVLCPLPIYLHDLSRYLALSGDVTQSRAVLGEFLRAQEAWQAGPHDAVLLAGRDVAMAVADARQRLQAD